MSKRPVWLRGYAGGDNSAQHKRNLRRIEAYLEAVAADRRGLPADPRRPCTL